MILMGFTRRLLGACALTLLALWLVLTADFALEHKYLLLGVVVTSNIVFFTALLTAHAVIVQWLMWLNEIFSYNSGSLGEVLNKGSCNRYLFSEIDFSKIRKSEEKVKCFLPKYKKSGPVRSVPTLIVVPNSLQQRTWLESSSVEEILHWLQTVDKAYNAKFVRYALNILKQKLDNKASSLFEGQQDRFERYRLGNVSSHKPIIYASDGRMRI